MPLRIVLLHSCCCPSEGLVYSPGCDCRKRITEIDAKEGVEQGKYEWLVKDYVHTAEGTKGIPTWDVCHTAKALRQARVASVPREYVPRVNRNGRLALPMSFLLHGRKFRECVLCRRVRRIEAPACICGQRSSKRDVLYGIKPTARDIVQVEMERDYWAEYDKLAAEMRAKITRDFIPDPFDGEPRFAAETKDQRTPGGIGRVLDDEERNELYPNVLENVNH